MDGRWKLAFAAGVLFSGVVGCSTTKPEPAIAPPPPPPGTNVVYVPEPTEDDVKKEGPLASSTMLIFANMWVDAIAKDPNRPAADREQNLSKARSVYQDVLTREPKNVDAILGLGQLYVVTGETEKLREVEERATRLHPTNGKVWAWVAVRRAQAKKWDSAAECYREAVKSDPENRTYRIQLGFTLARGGRYEEGYDWLSKAMREAEARYNIAKMMIHNNEVEKARLELRMSLKADPNFKAAGDELVALQNPGSRSGSDIRTVGHSEQN